MYAAHSIAQVLRAPVGNGADSLQVLCLLTEHLRSAVSAAAEIAASLPHTPPEALTGLERARRSLRDCRDDLRRSCPSALPHSTR